MKKLMGISILLFIVSYSYSQNKTSVFKGSFLVGPSFPVGKFSNPEKDTLPGRPTHNGAKVGTDVQIILSYQFKNSPLGIDLLPIGSIIIQAPQP